MSRHLPVIQSEPEDEARPVWQWIPIGAGFCFSIWLPLLVVAQWASARWLTSLEAKALASPGGVGSEAVLAAVLPSSLSLASAFLAGGVMVVRGAPGVPALYPALAGALCGLVVCSLGYLGGAIGGVQGVAVLVVLAVAGAGLSGLGAVLGRRRRILGRKT